MIQGHLHDSNKERYPLSSQDQEPPEEIKLVSKNKLCQRQTKRQKTSKWNKLYKNMGGI